MATGVDRCSSQHLRVGVGGPDLHLCTNTFVTKFPREDILHNHRLYANANADDEIEALDSARSSFSQALKECKERRGRSQGVANNKVERGRPRPASFDLNNATLAAGNLINNKYLHSATPSYRNAKGCSSERLPFRSNPRQIGARGLPSKWEDAERWIFSPVASSSYHHTIRRPKSKSGPLGPPGVAMYSPAPAMHQGQGGIHAAGSPFSPPVIVPDAWSFRVSGQGKGFSNTLEPCIARSVSVHGCTHLVCQETSLTSSQDDGVGDAKDADTVESRSVLRRDMATQMSPEGSCQSSPRRSSFSQSTTPSKLPIVEVRNFGSSKPEVRDVQMDERVTVTRWSKKYKGRNPSKGSEDVDEWKLKATEPRSSAWEVSETVKSLANLLNRARRDEAKITAWENLQKAKAEAAIRKLEMKLEKKRSSSMDKITKKLRSAQKKAQEMRSTILSNQALQVSKTSNDTMSFRTRQMGSLSGCFTCHAF